MTGIAGALSAKQRFASDRVPIGCCDGFHVSGRAETPDVCDDCNGPGGGDRQAGHSAVRHTIQDDIDDFFVRGSMSELRMAEVNTGYGVAVGPMASNAIGPI